MSDPASRDKLDQVIELLQKIRDEIHWLRLQVGPAEELERTHPGNRKKD